MKFSTNVQHIRQNLRAALAGDKAAALAGLRQALTDGAALLKTGDLTFWIDQFDVVETEDFLTTAYAVRNISRVLARAPADLSRRRLASDLEMAAEHLLTYTTDDDFCEMQSHYHWYYDLDGGFAYKESELGDFHVPDGKKISGDRRVAKRGDMAVEPLKLLT